MNRRAFLAGTISAALARPRGTRAQPPISRIGFLSGRSSAESRFVTDAFILGLREMGYVHGSNLTIEFRWADFQYDQLPALASDLVRRQVSVIATAGGAHVGLAAKRATSTIPIVFVSGGDPIAYGLVTSLSKPGGNVTGISMIAIGLAPKRVELLHELVAPPATMAMLVNPGSPYVESQTEEVVSAARALERRVLVLTAATSAELDRVFATLSQQGWGPSSSAAIRSSTASATDSLAWPRAIGFLRFTLGTTSSRSAA